MASSVAAYGNKCTIIRRNIILNGVDSPYVAGYVVFYPILNAAILCMFLLLVQVEVGVL